MEQPPGYKMLPVAIAAGGAVLIAAALFGGRWTRQDSSAAGSGGSPSGATAMAFRTYACRQCGKGINWGSDACSWCGYRVCEAPQAGLPPTATGVASPRPETEVETNVVRNAAAAANAAQGAAGPSATLTPAGIATAAPPALVSPRDQNAAGKEFIEGHWLGLEVIPLTPELAREYQIPKGDAGVLVDEITLEAAESGILAGDMVQSVDGRPTPDLRAFFLTTQRVQEQERAPVVVSRRGERMTFFMEARNTKALGFAQMEAAQPIQPGALSPHRARRKACTECHVIMQTGGQLPTDAGDIVTTPPPIARNTAVPHQYRGQCARCHVIK